MFLVLCKYSLAVLFTLPPLHLPFTSISGEFIVFFVQYFYVFFKIRVFSYLVTWCQNVGFPLEIIISAVN